MLSVLERPEIQTNSLRAQVVIKWEALATAFKVTLKRKARMSEESREKETLVIDLEWLFACNKNNRYEEFSVHVDQIASPVWTT